MSKMDPKHPPWNMAWVFLLWTRIGAAVWQGQALEDTLAKFIFHAFDRNKDDARELAIDALAENRKLTLGALLNKLRQFAKVPEGLDKDLREYKDERNWLVHHSYGEFVSIAHDVSKLNDLGVRIFSADLAAYRLICVFWDAVQAMAVEDDSGAPIPTPTAQQIRAAWLRETPTQSSE